MLHNHIAQLAILLFYVFYLGSQVSTSDSLTRPLLPLLPILPLAAPANTLVSLPIQLMKATVLTESSEYIHFHHDLSAPTMSTDMSQVGVALFLSLQYNFYHFTFPGLPFILIIYISLS